MKSTSLKEICVVALVISFIVFTLAPVVARLQRESAEARCQSNLHRLGEAMALYVADNTGRFPTNRPYTGNNHGVGSITSNVVLSAAESDPETGKPRVFDYGINWVEALYPYMWNSAQTTGQDWHSFWHCPIGSSTIDPTEPSDYCSTSYVFNGCLVEYWAGICRNQNKLMMIREFGRLTCATLRPRNQTVGDKYTPPEYAFLNNSDCGPSMMDTSALCTPHANGSFVLFADGHVKHFTLDYFPDFNANYRESNAWDKPSQQWWNYNRNPANRPEEKRLTIAITP